MSAPTSATGDGSPSPGFYPDPSIPGYVRYWNGGSWVPGTSRPAPGAGEDLPEEPHGGPAAPAVPAARRTPAPSVEETGPMFFDEDDPAGTPRQEPASVWQADTRRQTGFGGDRDARVSWGESGRNTPAAPDPDEAARDPRYDSRLPGRTAEPAADPTGGALPGVRSAGPAAGSDPDDDDSPPREGTVAIRVPRPGRGGPDRTGEGGIPTDGTVTIRPAGGARGEQATGRTGQTDGTMALRALRRAAAGRAPVPPPAQTPAPPPVTPDAPQARSMQPPAGPPAAGPPAAGPPAAGPLAPGPGGGAPSWAQQAHPLTPSQHGASGGAAGQPVVPWRPPADDPFLRAAQAQASARPAGLGKRFAARLIDTVVLLAMVGAASVPLVSRALAHIDDKVEAAKQTGETVTVWLIDGTTAGLFGGVLAALLLIGALYEALPTAAWGRTLGKKLCGLQVRDIESFETPTFGAALRRWLVYGLLGVLVVGVLNVLWCVFDRPWRQCWHDKAARTFVAG
ncbi:RDD family protein [Streptomyces sp. NBC_01498]|uniref:RDD family protein n=1 Tax=Streptomyces sp. NBC_01498 TaxID=2975870 RepID=UPI002E7B58D0|nr:RDD family protein [Streptomyces sp. NBC_01498]WTL26674.1 RDD family protein [Streptomyces sp. NBC_01498]